jgi:hypothetical protein
LADSGTLRLNVLTFEAREEVTSESIAETFRSSPRGETVILPNGNAIQRYAKTVVEGGEELLIYYWEVGNPVPPRGARIAVFSYTILATQATDEKIIAELNMLGKEVETAKFASTLNV